MEEGVYAFKFQNIKGIRYMLLLPLGFPFIFLLGPNVNVWIFMFILFAPMILAIVMMFIKMSTRDTITITDTYLDSNYFGKIFYDDILQISSPAMYAPAIRLKLRDGRKVTWSTNYKMQSKKDQLTYSHFTIALQQQLKKREQDSLSKPTLTQLTKKTYPESNTSFEDPDSLSLTEQFDIAQKKNNIKPWAIPVGLILAIASLVRVYGPVWFKQKNPFDKEAAKNSEEIFERRSSQAKLVLKKLVQRSGPLFLYSNDTTVKLTLLPDLDMTNPTGISAFKYTNASTNLEKFIAHPDSVNLDLYVIGKGDNFSKLTKSILNNGDTTKT
ncbi:hypothetical protein H7F33_03100 [Pedobacter sp. PAMC26386]|nr:hypothetical protein H7F33_03100 [Pedobacter sp. PAMC26386]